MSHMFTRPMRKEDAPQMVEWISRIKDANLLDPAVLNYAATNILCAYERNGAATQDPKLYVPVQTVYMFESLAPHPTLSPADFSRAIRDVVKVVSWEAQVKGIGELYFMSHDKNVNALAEHHGFDRLSGKLNDKGEQECKCMPLLRMKV